MVVFARCLTLTQRDNVSNKQIPRTRSSGTPLIRRGQPLETMILYSYCLRYDDGAAPNPYWGICTLAICKPAIRRKAKVGDWVVGLGSKHSPMGDIACRVVYTMKVTKVLSMAEYDNYCRKSLPEKIPDWNNSDFRRRVGDSIYDYSHPARPILHRSVHSEMNRQTDLGGLNALLSEHFYYFGDKPVDLPKMLLPIVHQTQGHKSHANERYVDQFVRWLEGTGHRRNAVLGEPQLKAQIMSFSDNKCRSVCSKRDQEEDEQDEIC